jgi:hypothetical protein
MTFTYNIDALATAGSEITVILLISFFADTVNITSGTQNSNST